MGNFWIATAFFGGHLVTPPQKYQVASPPSFNYDAISQCFRLHGCAAIIALREDDLATALELGLRFILSMPIQKIAVGDFFQGYKDLGGCQNYGPFLGTLNMNIRCRILIGTQKGTIILTSTHLVCLVSGVMSSNTMKFCLPELMGSSHN